ncbi:hypothetical protein [Nocardia rhamnosiphila]|uniref:DUF222 domain-containing protein n=1 Tax=Nocardia rhamnosiphila TaxID=426716 RepID=A0ABV2X258_9NOCA
MKDAHVDLVLRVSSKLKEEIAPTLTDDQLRTQAFMAAVILKRLAHQENSSEVDRVQDQRDREALSMELQSTGELNEEPAIRVAFARFRTSLDDDSLSALIEALHKADDATLRDPVMGPLSPIRRVLRARLNRELEYSR